MVDTFNMDDPELAGNIQFKEDKPGSAAEAEAQSGFRPESQNLNDGPSNTLDEPVSVTIVS